MLTKLSGFYNSCQCTPAGMKIFYAVVKLLTTVVDSLCLLQSLILLYYVTLTSSPWMALSECVQNSSTNCTLSTVISTDITSLWCTVCCQTKLWPHTCECWTRYNPTAAINLCFSPQDAVVDFEISMLAAVQTVLPNTSVHCCRFHLGQAWWRHMNSIGLRQIYKDKSSDASR